MIILTYYIIYIYSNEIPVGVAVGIAAGVATGNGGIGGNVCL